MVFVLLLPLPCWGSSIGCGGTCVFALAPHHRIACSFYDKTEVEVQLLKNNSAQATAVNSSLLSHCSKSSSPLSAVQMIILEHWPTAEKLTC